jgi:hypothetical protein
MEDDLCNKKACVHGKCFIMKRWDHSDDGHWHAKDWQDWSNWNDDHSKPWHHPDWEAHCECDNRYWGKHIAIVVRSLSVCYPLLCDAACLNFNNELHTNTHIHSITGETCEKDREYPVTCDHVQCLYGWHCVMKDNWPTCM